MQEDHICMGSVKRRRGKGGPIFFPLLAILLPKKRSWIIGSQGDFTRGGE